MAKLTFGKCDCGSKNIHGHFFVDGEEIGGPILSAEFARVMVLSALYMKGKLTVGQLIQFETQMVEMGLPDSMSPEERSVFDEMVFYGQAQSFTIELFKVFEDNDSDAPPPPPEADPSEVPS